MRLVQLKQDDFDRAAAKLQIVPAHIKAICEVEAPKGAFLPSGRLTILFERHHFADKTKHKFDVSNPDISSYKTGGYLGGDAEWNRYDKAFALDPEAARLSTSFGAFQIMGFNHKAAGYATSEEMVTAFAASEYNQLDGVVNFIMSDSRRWNALKKSDITSFVRLYNGKNYKINKYDKKYAEAFYKFGGRIGDKQLTTVLRELGYA